MRYSIAAAVLATGAMASIPGGQPPAEQPAVSTAFQTEIVTVTNCGPEVPDCPARSTQVSTNIIPSAPATTNVPVAPTTTPVVPAPGTSHTSGNSPEKPSSNVPVPPAPSSSKPAVSSSKPVETPSSKPVETPSSKPVTPTSKPVPSATSGNSPEKPTTPGAPAPSSPGAPGECVPSKSTTAITKSYTTVLTSVEYQTVDVPCATGPAQEPSASFTTKPSHTSGNSPVVPTTPGVPGGNATVSQPQPVPTAGAAGLAGSTFLAVAAGLVAAFAFA